MSFLTIEDALKYYDLNFDIDTVPIYITGLTSFEEVSFKKAVIRTDKRVPLGIVGNKYKLIPLKDILSNLQPFVECGTLDISRFYSEKQGARANCCFKVNELSAGLEGLAISAEFALRLSHDGSSKVLISILGRSEKGNIYPIGQEYTVSVRHTKHGTLELGKLENMLKTVKQEWAEFEDFMKYGATDPITDDEAKDFINTNMGVSVETKQGETAIEAIFKRWHGSVLVSMQHSIFGLYMAICDWCQEERSVRMTAKRKAKSDNEDTIRIVNLLNNKNIYKTWAGVKGFANISKGF
jgi:hypothetical protein